MKKAGIACFESFHRKKEKLSHGIRSNRFRGHSAQVRQGEGCYLSPWIIFFQSSFSKVYVTKIHIGQMPLRGRHAKCQHYMQHFWFCPHAQFGETMLMKLSKNEIKVTLLKSFIIVTRLHITTAHICYIYETCKHRRNINLNNYFSVWLTLVKMLLMVIFNARILCGTQWLLIIDYFSKKLLLNKYD